MYIDEINSPLKPNLHLGTIGLDKTTISHLYDRQESYPEPVIDYLFPEWKALNVAHSDYATISPIGNKKVRLTSTYYELTVGNQGNRPFANITIHIGTKDQPNLINMSVDALKNYLARVRDEILQRYGKDFVFDLKTMRIYNAEINVTFPIKFKFDSYRRVVDLMSSLHIGKAVFEKNNEFETYYMNDSKHEQLKIYSKSKEIEDLSNGLDSEVELMRFELTFAEQKLAFSSANTFRDDIGYNACSDADKRKCFLKDVTQESLEQLFFDETEELFTAMDKTLQMDTISNVRMSPFLNTIINRSLLTTLRSDSRSFIETVLLYYRDLETRKYHRPLLLDVMSLQSIIKDSYLDSNIKQLLEDALQIVIDHPDQFDDACKTFIGQSERYEELRDKLCCKHIYPMQQIQEDGKTHLIYWSNPDHTEPDHTFAGSVYYYLHKVLNTPDPAPNAHVMLTQNNPPIVYARLEYKPDCYQIAFFDDDTQKNCQEKAKNYLPFPLYSDHFNESSVKMENDFKTEDLPF